MLYRPDVDGLRAVAVLAVVAFHAFPGALPGGFAGVDVFFVISGYLITLDTQRRMSDGTFTLLDFYRRRARRIFPALILVLVSVLAAGSVILYRDEFEELLAHAAASALFAENFRLMAEAGYFDRSAALKPLLHLWSLAVEEQFYLLWPLAMLAAGRRALPVALSLAAVSFASLAVIDAPASYYSPLTRFWEIMAGAALALSRVPARWWFAPMGVVACAAAFMSSDLEARQVAMLLPVLGAVGIIAAGPDGVVGRALAARWMVYVGRVSFPLYLWHWPLLAFLRILTPEPSAAALWGAVALSAVLACLTYHMLEQPVRRRRPSLALGAVLVGVAVSTGAQGADPRPAAWHRSELLDDLRFEVPTGKRCPFAAATYCIEDGREAVVIGDSHAELFFGALRAAEPGRWMLVGKPGCAPVVGPRVGLVGRDCSHVDEIVRGVAASPTLQTVVLSFRGTYPVDRLSAGIDGAITALERGGKRVVLMVSVPELPFRPRDCAPRPLTEPIACAFPTQQAVAAQAELRRAVERLQAAHPALTVFDPARRLCDGYLCRINRDGVLMYRDANHLSDRGSRIVVDDLLQALSRPEA